MNRARLAQALNTIAMGFAEAAEALKDDGEDRLGERLQQARESVSEGFSQTATLMGAEGSLSQCPRHHKAYRDGKSNKNNPTGKFCATKADDAWSYNGWCSINPSNAAEYLRQVTAQ